MFSSKYQAWDTSIDYYTELDDEFHFTLDPCCTYESCKCAYGLCIDKGYDGLQESWFGNVFMNPPYDESIQWVHKGVEEFENDNIKLLAALLPARTDTELYHTYIWDSKKHRFRDGVEVRFIKGRLKFGSLRYWKWLWSQEFLIDGKGESKKNSLYKKYGVKNPAPFPSMLAIWR